MSGSFCANAAAVFLLYNCSVALGGWRKRAREIKLVKMVSDIEQVERVKSHLKLLVHRQKGGSRLNEHSGQV